jgi:hypothetical protein
MSASEGPVKKWSICAILAAVLLIVPEAVFAAKSEPPAGICSQEPCGDFAYKGDSPEVKDYRGFGKKTRSFGNAKIEVLSALPNTYFMATPMNFDIVGKEDEQLLFNNKTFQAIVSFMASLRFERHDTALYHGLSSLKKATSGIALGIGAKIINFEAVIDHHPDTAADESKSLTMPVPMVYLGFKFP